jgi:hypothetical protein
MSWKASQHIGSYNTLIERIGQLQLPLEIYRPTVLGEPLYFNYIFAREIAPLDLAEVPKIVPLRWVKFRDRIAIMADAEIAEIRMLAGERSLEAQYQLHTANRVPFGERYRGRIVEITGGVFGGIYGRIIRAARRDQVVVEIRFVGRPTNCTVVIRDLRLVEPRPVSPHQSGKRFGSSGAAATVESSSAHGGAAEGDCTSDDGGAGVAGDEV